MASPALPGSVPRRPSEGTVSRYRCILAIRELPRACSDDRQRALALNSVARLCWQFVRGKGSKFSALQLVEAGLSLPRISASRKRFWFGRVKGFTRVEQLAEVVDNGVPVRVLGQADISVALAYGNHNSTTHHQANILHKIYSDVCLGRAFIFPRSTAHLLPGLRLASLGVVASATKVRIIHDLTFNYGRALPSVNKDTDFESAPPVNLRHVLRNFIWRILYLRRKWPFHRIVLRKMDVADAFRQAAVSWERNQVFAYTFRDWLVVDRRLMFGWANSPGYFCLFSDALNHAHVNTSFADAVV